MYKTTARSRKGSDWLSELEKIKNAVAEAAFDAKDKAGDLITDSYESAKEKSLGFHKSLGRYAKEKPLKTIGAALFTGMVLGMVLKKRKHKK